jgi:murein DD-endopeptidase MepM/ murein hydrolase activator NlpD
LIIEKYKILKIRDIIIRDWFYLTLAGVMLVLINALITSPFRVDYPGEEISPEDTLQVMNVKREYGFPVDSFFIVHGKVQKNQNITDLLVRYGVSYAAVDQLAKLAKPVFDVRKMKTGNNYALFSQTENIHKPEWFVYEDGPVDYIVFALGDSLYVKKEQKEVVLVQKRISGTIISSLWNDMIRAGGNPLLAIELSEIYAWTVDFFGIQNGDHFEVIYDEAYVDSTSIGIRTVHAARFNHYGSMYTAFRFEQDGVMSYFDHEGKSLRKAFLKAPLKFSRISSRFSHNRFHPVLKISRPHHGIDYAAPTGTPVYTIGDGIVIKKGFDPKGGGRFVKVKHNSVYTTVYMHFSKFAEGIAEGKKVRQGEIIGYVGSSGLATGPHLDFRVYKNGHPIDPLKIESPPVDPVHQADMDSFRHVVNEWNKRFEALSRE